MGPTAKQLLSIQQFTPEFLLSFFKQVQKNKASGLSALPPVLKNEIVCLMFLEPSTRTRVSFEIAAKKLGADTVLIQREGTSLEKGETILDTFQTIHAMGCRYFVYRSSDSSIQDVAKHFGDKIVLINAGDGVNEHPTQALIDGYTIWERHQDFKNIKVAILGDLARSRVARSDIRLLNMFGVTPYISGPVELLKSFSDEKVQYCTSIDAAVRDADVVMMLRIQKERSSTQTFNYTEKDYLNQYGLTIDRLKLAKPNAMVMHPGPFNRNVEIESTIADGFQSSILEQVNNGVWTRAELFKTLAGRS
ncbi:MAG: aspartate carbamoyltransferase catalytic subunit [Bdellovibrionota bacterium]